MTESSLSTRAKLRRPYFKPVDFPTEFFANASDFAADLVTLVFDKPREFIETRFLLLCQNEDSMGQGSL